MAVLSNGEMPPPDETPLSDGDRAKIIDWLASEIQVASQVRRAEGGYSSFRRLTRYEYNYALQDVLDYRGISPKTSRQKRILMTASKTVLTFCR